MITAAKTVDAFLATLSDDERAVFTQVRKLFRADRRVTESMEYKMPTYKIGEAMVGAFNKQKNYLCVYLTPAAVDPHRAELKHLDCGKSCIRFRRPEDLPLTIIAQIVRASVKLAA